jgi:hypothetical protein
MPKTEEIENWFTYHAPTPAQLEGYTAIRDKAKELAHTINTHAPESADKTASIRQLREAVMMANASIACHVPAPEKAHGN